MSINPFCEIAIEEAIRLKEKKIADEVSGHSCVYHNSWSGPDLAHLAVKAVHIGSIKHYWENRLEEFGLFATLCVIGLLRLASACCHPVLNVETG